MDFYNAAVAMFIRPPRAQYTQVDLGPTRLTVANRQFVREDITLTNRRNMKIQCSHFLPVPEQRTQKLPCLVYLHGNCGCRVDALEILHLVLGLNISLFALDFSGSGEYISLGYYEKDDAAVAFEYLRAHPHVANIGVWGMSMGAATALWFSSLHADWVTCIIADSPFAKLTRLAQEIVHQQEMKAPKWLVSGTVSVGLKMVRKSIKKKAKFDIRNNKPVAYIHTCKAPVLFGHADSDRVIPSKHSAELFEKYPNLHKRFVTFAGDHNTPRPAKFYDAASRFLWEYLLEPAHKQAVAAPLKTLANTPLTRVNNIWLVRRLPVNPEDAQNILLAEALCLLIVDQHGIKMATPFTEQPLQALKWHKIAVYWSVSSHFCVDFKHGADNLHGRWIFSTLEADAIMDATKKQVTELKPRSKKKLLLRGPTAEGLESVAKGIKAFSPKSQLQKETAEAESAAPSPPPKIQEPLVNEDKILVPAIRDPSAQRRVEHVSILPRPSETDIEETAVHMPAPAALPWEAYATQPPPLRSMASASSPALLTPKRDAVHANGDVPNGASNGIAKDSSLERRNTTQVTSASNRRHLHPSSTLTTLETGAKSRKKSGDEIKDSKKHHRRHRTKSTEKNEITESNSKQKERLKDPRDKEPHDKDARKQRPSGAREPADSAMPHAEKRKPSGTKEAKEI